MSRKGRAYIDGTVAFATPEGGKKLQSQYPTDETSGHLETARLGMGNLKVSPSRKDGSSSDLKGVGSSGARDRKDLENMPIFPRMKYEPRYTTKDERKRRRVDAADSARVGLQAHQAAAGSLGPIPGTRSQVHQDVKECKNSIDMAIADLEATKRGGLLKPNSPHEAEVINALNLVILEETRHLETLQRELRAMTPEGSPRKSRSSGSPSSMSTGSSRGARNAAPRDTASSRAPYEPDGPRATHGSPTIHGFNKRFAAGYQST